MMRTDTVTSPTRQRQRQALEVLLWQSHLREYAAYVVMGLLVGLVAWMWLWGREAQHYIQVVQVQEGQVLPLGAAMDVLAYRPVDAQWMDLIQEWLMDVRTRNQEPVSTQVLWQQAAAHTCEEARKGLASYEQAERPFAPATEQKKSVTVERITLSKVADKVFYATWQETITQRYKQDIEQWKGTFKVQRIRPDRPADNRLGLCISWFTWDQR